MSSRDRRRGGLPTWIGLIAALVGLCGCAATRQASSSAPLGKSVGGSGFLGDLYPRMQKGEGPEPLRVYRTPEFESPAAFAQYTRVLIDPVAMYSGPDSNLPELSAEERERIATAVYAQIYDKLSNDYEMATEIAANTLRLQVAAVDAEESSEKLEAVSYLPMPVGLPGAKIALIQLAKLSTGKPPFAGEITVEAKLTDAQTGEIIAAMIDRRVGARRPIIGLFERDTYDSWADVDQAIRYFAERVRYNFCVRRGGADCVVPEE